MRLHHSNRMEVLAGELARLMRTDPCDPFTPERIVVAHPTIGRWLSLELARALGVAANVRFELPAEFAWSIMREAVPELSGDRAYAPERLRWRIHDVLPEPGEGSGEGAVRGYLRDGDPRKRFELADRLSRVFDRCLLYRPDWIREWERGPAPHWQARLWRRLAGDGRGAGEGRPAGEERLAGEERPAGEGWPDEEGQPIARARPATEGRVAGEERSTAQSRPAGADRSAGEGRGASTATHWVAAVDAFHARLAAGERPCGWPRRAAFFGVSSLSPSYIEILRRAAEGIEIHLFMLAPCREYWGDIRSRREIRRRIGGGDPGAGYFTEGNELLAAWGRAGRDTFDALVEGENVEWEDHFVAPEDACRLAAVQRDVLDLRLASEAAQAEAVPEDARSAGTAGAVAPAEASPAVAPGEAAPAPSAGMADGAVPEDAPARGSAAAGPVEPPPATMAGGVLPEEAPVAAAPGEAPPQGAPAARRSAGTPLAGFASAETSSADSAERGEREGCDGGGFASTETPSADSAERGEREGRDGGGFASTKAPPAGSAERGEREGLDGGGFASAETSPADSAERGEREGRDGGGFASTEAPPAGSVPAGAPPTDQAPAGTPEGGWGRPPPTDDSIRIHVCHSPLREAEVLHDQLLALFDAHRDLEPADVLVLTPNLGVYGPAIEAVFGAAGRIRCNVLRTPGSESRTLRAFLDLLDLPGSRLGAEAVLAPLDAPAVRGRFGIGEGDLPALRGLVREAGIRWGADQAHRGAEGLPETAGHTWRQGLRRLLLGYAMPDADALVGGLVPCPAGADGFGAGEVDAERLGRFVSYCEEAIGLGARLAGERRPSEWTGVLRGVADRFLADGPGSTRGVAGGIGDRRFAREPAGEVDAVRALVRDFGREAGHGESPVPFALVRDVLRERVRDASGEPVRLADGVTVAGLAPGRVFPAAVICVAGMNDGAFPRTPSYPSFDLMAAGPARRGDRDDRHEDRFAFLEALLAARRCFLVSYTGRGLRDDAPIPPSVLVDELKDYLVLRFPGAAIEVRHPLQPFSPRYFLGGSAPEGAAGVAGETARPPVASFSPASYGTNVAAGVAGEAVRPPAGGAAQGDGGAAPLPVNEAADGTAEGSTRPAGARAGGAPAGGAAGGRSPDGGGLFSYSRGMCEAARAILAGEQDPARPGRFARPLPEPGESRRVVDPGELVSFFAHPARFFLRHRLGVRLEAEDATLDEEEPFELDGLERYRLRSEVWSRMRAGAAPERTEALMSGRGRLPQAGLGRVVHEREWEEAQQLEKQLAPYRAALDAPPREVDFEIGGFRVVGALERIGPDGTMVWPRLGRLRARDRIEIRLRQLVWAAAGNGPVDAVGISRERKGRQYSWKCETFPAPEHAGEQIERWLRAWWRGLSAPLPFYPETSYAYARGIARPGRHAGGNVQEAARARAQAAWLGDDHRPGEGDDPCLRLVHDGDPVLTPEFEDLAVGLLLPLFAPPVNVPAPAAGARR